jgi:hypothetical protein
VHEHVDAVGCGVDEAIPEVVRDRAPVRVDADDL